MGPLLPAKAMGQIWCSADVIIHCRQRYIPVFCQVTTHKLGDIDVVSISAFNEILSFCKMSCLRIIKDIKLVLDFSEQVFKANSFKAGK